MDFTRHFVLIRRLETNGGNFAQKVVPRAPTVKMKETVRPASYLKLTEDCARIILKIIGIEPYNSTGIIVTKTG